MKSSAAILECFFLLSIAVLAVGAEKDKGGNPFEPLRTTVAGISGWSEQTEQYRYFTARDFYGIIDGGAAEHEKQGLKNGIGVSLTNNTQSLGIYFENFGTFSRAKGMVNTKKKSLSDTRSIPQAKVAPAMYEEVIGGCIVFWAKGRYYIEMTLTGYDSIESALQDAGTFIDAISAVITK